MDVVDDILDRVKKIIGSDNAHIIIKLEQEERNIRRHWGGSEHYVTKRCKQIKAAALADLRRGVPIKEVISSSGLCRASIYKLLK